MRRTGCLLAGALSSALSLLAASALAQTPLTAHLLSTPGQPPWLSLPLPDDAALATACYSLPNQADNQQLPAPRFRLVRQGERLFLEISSHQPVDRDQLSITVYAGCGANRLLHYQSSGLLRSTPSAAQNPPAPGSSAQPHQAPRHRPPPSPHAAVSIRATPFPVRPEPASPRKPPPASTGAGDQLAQLEQRVREQAQLLQALQQSEHLLEQALRLSATALAQPATASSQRAPQPPATTVAGASPPVQRGELLLTLLAGVGIAAAASMWWRRRQAQIAALREPEIVAPPPRPTPAITIAEPVSLLSLSIPPAESALTPPPPPAEHGDSDEQRPAALAGEDMLELAEIMLSFGRLQGAADTVAEYIENYAPQNVGPWLLLLDLYRRGNMRSEFEQLSQKIRARFNAELPSWERSTTVISGLRTLEDYPHILAQISALWGQAACVDYLHTLTQDNRDGQRSGFPLEVIEEIVLLLRILADAYSLQRPS